MWVPAQHKLPQSAATPTLKLFTARKLVQIFISKVFSSRLKQGAATNVGTKVYCLECSCGRCKHKNKP